jgi:hypothetical protein
MGLSASQSSSKSKSMEQINTTDTMRQKQQGSRSTSDNPWEAQAPYLQNLFAGAQNLRQQGQTMGGAERAAYETGLDVTQQQLGDTQASAQGLMGAWDQLRGHQRDLTGKYEGVVDKVLGTTMGGLQGQAADFAGNNPYLDQAVQSSWDNANKMLGQQVGGAGGINHQASSSGNMSSSRAGVSEGLATAEMADRGQQNELALRQSAYDQGLGQANQMVANDMTMAAMLEQNPADAAMILQGQQGSQAGYQDMINNILSNQIGYAQGQQGGRMDQQQKWDNLNNFYGIIGANNWGGSSDTDYKESSTGTNKTKGTSLGKTKGSQFGFGLAYNPSF